MPITRMGALTEGRADLTGETRQQAQTELRRLGSRTPAIPDAISRGQAPLEARVLLLLGKCLYQRSWHPGVPFMVSSVTPKPDQLILRIRDDYLPDIIQDILPSYAEEGKNWMNNLTGIPGLRFRCGHDRVTLSRVGQAGYIVIPVKQLVWKKACAVAKKFLRADGDCRYPWEESPEKLTMTEEQSWNRDAGEDHAANRFLSQILRRLPGLCPPPQASYHDLWPNWIGNGCTIKLEWMYGPSHGEVLRRLFDAGLTPDMEIDLDHHRGESAEDLRRRVDGSVTLRSREAPVSSIVLRRLPAADWGRSNRTEETVEARVRSGRAAVEERCGYYVRRPRPL